MVKSLTLKCLNYIKKNLFHCQHCRCHYLTNWIVLAHSGINLSPKDDNFLGLDRYLELLHVGERNGCLVQVLD